MYEADLLSEEDLATLEHYGIKGQKWGQRRFQNPDGSYTELGKERRRVGYEDLDKKKEEDANANKDGIKASEQTAEEFYNDEKIGGKAYKDMTRKELRAAKKRARHNEAERRAKREFNRDKKQALEDGDLAFISKNINKFTNEEIDEAIVRYNKMQNLRNLETANRKDASYYMEKASKFLNSAEKVVTPITNISNKINEASKKASEKRSQQISEEKNATELSYLKNPKLKPLTAAEELKNEKQKIDNDKARNEGTQTRIDTRWKAFMDEEKYRDYKNLSVEDFKNKWGSYDNSGGGKGKGGGDSKKDKKASKEDAIKKSRSIDWEDDDAVNKFFEDMGFNGQASSKKALTGWFSKKNKEKVKGSEYDLDDERVNNITKKYLSKLKDTEKDYWKENPTRTEKWKKDLQKHDSDVIDDWVKDMKKKYMKEQNLNSKAAEEKAEAYVDAWLNAYDEGKL